MANNSSLVSDVSPQQINNEVIFVQFVVAIFLCINMFLFMTFLKKESFYTSTRYILFALTLSSDSLFLIITDVLLILSYLKFPIQVWLCLIISAVVSLYVKVTPVTLTAMTLERYVAICMPLRHAELCSTRNTKYCILIIHGLSSVQNIVIFSIFFSLASLSFYKERMVCRTEIFTLKEWQDHLRSAVNQLYFLIMCIIIVFSYVKIMKVAKAASGEDKKSTWKGLRTVILHTFQLLLCLIQLWCPFVEAAVRKIDFMVYVYFRYFNYIIFILTPRCLSPLIYGLRDDLFFQALQNFCSAAHSTNVCYLKK